MRFLIRWTAGLLSLVSLVSCRTRETPPAPTQPGVTAALSYPVLLIGQSSLDVRDSEEALTTIPGASMLNLNERTIVDVQGRLFGVTRAEPVAGQGSIMKDMGTNPRRYFVDVAARGRPSWPEIQALVLEQVRSPRSLWAGSGRTVQYVRDLRDVGALIEAARTSWDWPR